MSCYCHLEKTTIKLLITTKVKNATTKYQSVLNFVEFVYVNMLALQKADFIVVHCFYSKIASYSSSSCQDIYYIATFYILQTNCSHNSILQR